MIMKIINIFIVMPNNTLETIIRQQSAYKRVNCIINKIIKYFKQWLMIDTENYLK